MRCGIIEFMPTYGLNDYVLMGLRLLKGGQAVWEYPVVKWQLGFVNGLWVNIATANEVDADKLVVRLGHALTPNRLRIFDSGERELAAQIYETPLPIQTQEALQEFPYDLPVTPSSTPPPGQPAPGSPVLLNGLSLDKTQVNAGGRLAVTASVTVNASFRGHMVTFLVKDGYPWSPVSTGLRDFLPGSYSVPLEIIVLPDTPPGTYPVTWRVLDAQNNILTEFTTEPIITVLPSLPPAPTPTGVVINSLTVSPDKVKPGEKVTATAQLMVSGGFKGLMGFNLLDAAGKAFTSAATSVKDWLAGNYPVYLEVTVPQNTPAGSYQGIWYVMDSVTNKQLASKDIQVEVVAPAPSPAPGPTPAPASNWLTPLIGVASLAAVGGLVTQMPKIMQQLTGADGSGQGGK